MTVADPWSPTAFEAKYAAEDDPWRFATSPYELERYRAILDILGRDRYGSAYEPACSIGVLTAELARRCDLVRATDVADSAVTRARRRCAGFANVDVEVASVQDWPGRRFDLVVFSEVGYYFDEQALDRVLDTVVFSGNPGGELVACHWTGHSADHVLSGAVVHRHLEAHAALRPLRSASAERFLLQSWTMG